VAAAQPCGGLDRHQAVAAWKVQGRSTSLPKTAACWLARRSRRRRKPPWVSSPTGDEGDASCRQASYSARASGSRLAEGIHRNAPLAVQSCVGTGVGAVNAGGGVVEHSRSCR
jgi:hypothetical protein